MLSSIWIVHKDASDDTVPENVIIGMKCEKYYDYFSPGFTKN